MREAGRLEAAISKEVAEVNRKKAVVLAISAERERREVGRGMKGQRKEEEEGEGEEEKQRENGEGEEEEGEGLVDAARAYVGDISGLVGAIERFWTER